MNRQNRETSKLITITAFLIGYVLIDRLNSNEQNALGNFFMLIGQTLCTSGSENFRRDWKDVSNPTNTFSDSSSRSQNEEMSKDDLIRVLKNARDVFSEEIDKL